MIPAITYEIKAITELTNMVKSATPSHPPDSSLTTTLKANQIAKTALIVINVDTPKTPI
jgi:hypothetical protein